MGKILISDILALKVSERVRLAQDIWDSISAVPDAVPLSQAEREELNRRLEDQRANPAAASPWADVRARILRRR